MSAESLSNTRRDRGSDSSKRSRRLRLVPTTVKMVPTLMVLFLCQQEHGVTVQAFSHPAGVMKQSTLSSLATWHQRVHPNNTQQRMRATSTSLSFAIVHPRSLTTSLSVAHTPPPKSTVGGGPRNHAASDEMEHHDGAWFSSSSSSSSSAEMDNFEMDWSTIIDPPESLHHHHHTEPVELLVAAPPDPLTRQDVITLSLLAASVTAFMGFMIKFSGAGAWRYYLAGGVCAAVSHAIPVPVDVVKTRKQVDPAYCDLTMSVAVRKLVETEGLAALFVGMGPTVFGYFLEGAVKFGVYEILKPWLGLLMPNKFMAFCACACFSGLAAGIMLCPMEALRIRLVAEREYAQQGWVRGGLRMMQVEGWSGLFRGLMPMLYKQIPYTITKNVSFDFLTKFMYRTWTVTGGGAASLVIPFAAAAISSVMSCLSSQPGDMLLSLVNAHEGERRRTRDLVQQIYRSDRGIRGFMVGVKTRLLHVGLIVTVQLLIYDVVKRLVGIAATGTV